MPAGVASLSYGDPVPCRAGDEVLRRVKALVDDYDICPKCGQKIIQGAMKCLACNAVLKTEEEQKAMIQKFMEPDKGFNVAALRKMVLYLVVFGVIYYFFQEEIKALLQYLMDELTSARILVDEMYSA